MPELILRIHIRDAQRSRDALGEDELCNTIRRTAHAIEGRRPLKVGDQGRVLDKSLNPTGTWHIE